MPVRGRWVLEPATGLNSAAGWHFRATQGREDRVQNVTSLKLERLINTSYFPSGSQPAHARSNDHVSGLRFAYDERLNLPTTKTCSQRLTGGRDRGERKGQKK